MWPCLFLVVLLQATRVLTQQSYGDLPGLTVSRTFEFHGCAVVDLNGFSDSIVFSDGVLNPKRCQAACQGQRIAALFANSCRCGNDPRSFSPLDSSACDNPCMGDQNLGMCGSICPKKGRKISTIYMAKDTLSYESGQDKVSSSHIDVSQTSPPSLSLAEGSTGNPALPSTSTSSNSGSSSWSNAIPTTSAPGSIAVPWPSVILFVDPPANPEDNLNNPGPGVAPQIPGRGFRPIGSNTTVYKNNEHDGGPPVPAVLPKSQAHILQKQLPSVLGGLAVLFAIIA